MTKLEILKHQREALEKAIDAIGQLNSLGLTMGYDTDKMAIARNANKAAWWDLNSRIHNLEKEQ